MKHRIEQDSLGAVQIPASAFYGAQTQRALDNFQISGLVMPRPFIQALGLIKAACATVNLALGQLDPTIAATIIEAAEAVAAGKYDEHFPLDVFQTGSGTSTHMNANEVIAHVASTRLGSPVHPNDHVNRSQSSNDVIPTAIHLSCRLEIQSHLLPALEHLFKGIQDKSQLCMMIVKTGRTHLMDAMPLTLGQELGGWASQIEQHIKSIKQSAEALQALAIGGTAVGTGINAPPAFGTAVAKVLSARTKIPFYTNPNYFSALSFVAPIVELSGQLRSMATTLIKISNDLRLMNSGPLAGFAEITLPPLQPGSSIMPGKINPVMPEAVMMAAVQVIGLDAAIGMAASLGSFQLNTMLPLLAYNSLMSLQLISQSAQHLCDKAIRSFTVNEAHIASQLANNPILMTALNPLIGYEKGARIVKRAYQEKRSIKEVAKEMLDLSAEELDRLLDPRTLTKNQ
ncbi:MAG: class II fumarate hydratase [Gammaproteobacteria bacterium]|nr:class II fumarate hydratase [Gammaproteobacteria bacterium]MBP9729542.1 class II fumarate hydratase [Gammaproteobacteria bacterium]